MWEKGNAVEREGREGNEEGRKESSNRRVGLGGEKLIFVDNCKEHGEK